MRLIDADKITITRQVYVGALTLKERLRRLLESQPTVDAEPVRHGHWIRNDNGTYSCSECQSWIPNEQHYYARYCLHCGAKMDRKGEENDGIQTIFS